jgi:Uma2 family endonuclease
MAGNGFACGGLSLIDGAPTYRPCGQPSCPTCSTRTNVVRMTTAPTSPTDTVQPVDGRVGEWPVWTPDPDRQAAAGWRVEDLLGLPPHAPRRIELRDGVLRVCPSPTVNHQEIGNLLWMWFRQHGQPGYRAITDVGIQFDTRRTLEPDLLLVRTPVQGNPHYLDPDEVVLVVEVVSPGTQERDRVEKPAIYARAHIPHYWRIEQDPLRVYAFSLGERGYVAVGAADTRTTPVLLLDQVPGKGLAELPFPIRLDLADITP